VHLPVQRFFFTGGQEQQEILDFSAGSRADLMLLGSQQA